MKCPCCGGQSDAELLVTENRVYMRDGVVHKLDAGAARLFKKLLTRDFVPRPEHQWNVFSVNLAKLRNFITDLGLSYKVEYKASERAYYLKRNVS